MRKVASAACCRSHNSATVAPSHSIFRGSNHSIRAVSSASAEMRLERGRLWESRAATNHERHGLAILARGYRCRLGELDIVCRDEPALVIVEVRARSRGALCSAVDSIDAHKRRRIVQATRHLLMRHAEWQTAVIRFDVVAFDAIDTPEPQIRWIQNAFDAS
jgi:putative endonuclease